MHKAGRDESITRPHKHVMHHCRSGVFAGQRPAERHAENCRLAAIKQDHLEVARPEGESALVHARSPFDHWFVACKIFTWAIFGR